MTIGVRTTASAKLNSSARRRLTPSDKPVEMVAPEREKPRKGRHSPCTAPITIARNVDNSPACVSLKREEIMINSPDAARPVEMMYLLSKSCSI